MICARRACRDHQGAVRRQELAFSNVTRLRMNYSLLAAGVIPEVHHVECGLVALGLREERIIAHGTIGEIGEVIKVVIVVSAIAG